MKERVLTGVVAVVIGFQVGVPVAMLTEGDRRWFGWHMLAGNDAVIRLVTVDGDGRETNAAARYPRFQPELDWVSLAPTVICPQVPGAELVRVTRESGQEDEVACRSA